MPAQIYAIVPLNIKEHKVLNWPNIVKSVKDTFLHDFSLMTKLKDFFWGFWTY